MRKIGLLSDTHNHYDPKFTHYFRSCDELWHAGDIGSMELIERLEKIAPVRAVYGNIDGQELRLKFPKIQSFFCEKVKVLLTHIGGYPHKYPPEIQELLALHQPQLFICGHSHILKVIYDKQYELLHINPGAAGIQGFHQVQTLITFYIDGTQIRDLELIELEANSL